MKLIAVARLSATFALGLAIFLTACSSGDTGSNSNGPLNLAGTWTVTTTSTQGHANFSQKASVTQSGVGLGVNGMTMLSAGGAAGQIVLTQSGTSVTGTIPSPTEVPSTISFTGIFGNGNLTLSGTVACRGSASYQTLSVSGALTSNSFTGNYTLESRGSKCYSPSDAGTFVAMKQ